MSHRVQPGSFQADLMDLKKYGQWNKGYKYLLNIIDIYSRYAWSFPIKQKTPEQIKELIRKVMNEVNPSDIWITFDKGSEFKGSVKKLLDDRGAKIHLNDPDSIHSHNTVGMIERFNRTMLNKIRRYMTQNDTVTYVDAIDDMVNNYNHTVHSSIFKTPHSVLKK